MDSELNTFFPFDPYKLPRSGSYIQGVYREWSSVVIDDDEEDEEDDEDDVEGEDAEEEDGHGSRPQDIIVNGVRLADTADDADELGESFGGMSISPNRPVAMSISVS